MIRGPEFISEGSEYGYFPRDMKKKVQQVYMRQTREHCHRCPIPAPQTT